MIALYLGFNCVLYAVFAVWCALAPKTTSSFVGLAPLNAAGESEYLAVYGGLQAGLAAFYLLALLAPDHRRTAILMSLFLYGGIVLFRSFAIARLGWSELGNARMTYGLEITLFLGALALALRGNR
jgi:hypothetical protein